MSNMLRKLLVPLCAGLFLAGVPASGSAQGSPNNNSVYFTFSQPVTLPQVTLPAGRYLFELANLDGNRNVVVVYSGDRLKHLATLMTIPTLRADFPNDAEVRFMETAANTPRAIRTWWYPGQRTGWEFIYPREQAMTLAKNARQPVLTTASNATSEEMKTAALARVDREGQQTTVADNENRGAAAIAGDVERGEVGPAATTAATRSDDMTAAARTGNAGRRADQAAVADNRTTSRTRLPQTASSTPSIALLGLVALCATAVLRFGRRHRIS